MYRNYMNSSLTKTLRCMVFFLAKCTSDLIMKGHAVQALRPVPLTCGSSPEDYC